MTVQKLNESKEVLKTNENGKGLHCVIIWLLFDSAKTLKKYPAKIIIYFCDSLNTNNWKSKVLKCKAKIISFTIFLIIAVYIAHLTRSVG